MFFLKGDLSYIFLWLLYQAFGFRVQCSVCIISPLFETYTLKIIQIKSLSKSTWDSAEILTVHSGLWEKVGLRKSVYRFKLSRFCLLHWRGKESRVGGGISCCLGVWKKAGSLLRMVIYQLRKKKKSMQKESVPFNFHWNCKYVAFLLYFSFKWYSYFEHMPETEHTGISLLRALEAGTDERVWG